VGDDPLPLGDSAEVLADIAGVVDVVQQRGPGRVDRRDQRGVGLDPARGRGGEGGLGRKSD
jgi:hypothetical protein